MWREMGIEVKVFILHVKILLYHWSDPFYDEVSIETDEGSAHEYDYFIFHDDLVFMTLKETITWMEENNYFRCWFLPMNWLQDGTPYDGSPVENSPEFMPLDNSLNRDILHSFCFCCVLSRFLIDEEVIDEEENNMRFSFPTPKEITIGLKRISESHRNGTW